MWEHDFIKIVTTDLPFLIMMEVGFLAKILLNQFFEQNSQNFSFKRIYCVGGNTKSLLNKFGQAFLKALTPQQSWQIT